MVDTEGEGPSEPLMLNEIELVFKPHPTEMAGDNSLIKALKENSIRYIKTTANATGEYLTELCKFKKGEGCIQKGEQEIIPINFYSGSSKQVPGHASNVGSRHRIVGIRQAIELLYLHSTVSWSVGSFKRLSDVKAGER